MDYFNYRDGRLFAAHTISQRGQKLARWYDFDVHDWPGGGDPKLTQSGEIDAGEGIHTFYPAIASNGCGGVGMVVGRRTMTGRGVDAATVVATGLVAGLVDATRTGVGEYALLARAVDNEGLATRPTKFGVSVGGLGEDSTKLTISEWLSVMLILAVLPATSETGPSHSFTSQPGLGNTSIVTVRP